MGFQESSRGRRVTARGEHLKLWGEILPVAASYAAVYEIFYHLSTPSFLITAGLRLSCLIFLPKRFWPALVLGEFLPLLEVALFCEPQFGWSWSVVVATPTVLLYMGWFGPLQKMCDLKEADGQPRMGLLLVLALFAASTNALRDTSAVAAIVWGSSKEWPNVSLPSAFCAFFLGAYLGALTVVPTVMAVVERGKSKAPSWNAFRRSPLLRDVMCTWAVISALSILAQEISTPSLQQAIRLAMVLPVVVMGFRHRWHGTAIAGLVAGAGLEMSSDIPHDPAVIQFQVILAAVVTIGFLLKRKARTVSQSAGLFN